MAWRAVNGRRLNRLSESLSKRPPARPCRACNPESPSQELSNARRRSSCPRGLFPEPADQDELPLHGPLTAQELRGDLGVRVLLQSQPRDQAQVLVRQHPEEPLELLGDEEREVRSRLGADDLVQFCDVR